MSQVIQVFMDEARASLLQAQQSIEPHVFAGGFTAAFRQRLHAQQAEAFGKQGAEDSWAPLSDWRKRVRKADGPILRATGSFQAQVMAFRGNLDISGDSFDFLYPGAGEADGRYFGLTAGQKVNPLAKKSNRPGPRGGTKGTWDSPAPLARTPRPILFGELRIKTDADAAIRLFMALFGMGDEPGDGEA